MLQLPPVYELMPKQPPVAQHPPTHSSLLNPNREAFSSSLLSSTSPVTYPSASSSDYFSAKRQSVSSSISVPSPSMEKPPLMSSNSDPGSNSGVRLPSLPSLINKQSQSSYSHAPQIQLPPVGQIHQLPAAMPRQDSIQPQYVPPPPPPPPHSRQQMVPMTHMVPNDIAKTHVQQQVPPQPQQLPQHFSRPMVAGGPPSTMYTPYPGSNMTTPDQLQRAPPALMHQQPAPVYYYQPMYPPGYVYPQYGYPPTINYGDNQMSVTKRRIIKRRTRTGCLTCRKRRIKCDERKPGCFNCERSKKVCLGYENLQKVTKKRDRSLDLKDDEESSHDEDEKPRRVSVGDVMN